jgi:DNA-binding HxlR family transcriptional regulator
MRSYREFCAAAKALDVVGDRWTLLIVRELLLCGACRYSDLRNGLPGIATNLLAERLRELEQAGLVHREAAPPPIATTVFSLTPRGRELEAVLQDLLRWGIPYMTEGPAPGDAFRNQWLAWPVETFLRDRQPDLQPVRIALRLPDDELIIEAANGQVHVRPGHIEDPDAVLAGPPHAILAVLTGQLQPERAGELGLRHEGDISVLERLLPG